MQEQLKSVKRIESLMDTGIKLPGGYSVGLDGIIGLIPGIGDVLTTSVSSFIVYKALKLKVPKIIILRMLLNMLIDFLMGVVPVVGDIFDFFFKSNVRNAKLLHNYAQTPNEIEARSYGEVALALSVLIIAFVCVVWLSTELIMALFQWIF